MMTGIASFRLWLKPKESAIITLALIFHFLSCIPF